jgi:GT2 family glycosyltransferase
MTGRVTPVGDPRAVPSTRDETEEIVWDRPWDVWALLPNNMAVHRERFLAFGGFDERFDTAGEDLDVAFRWLSGGGTVRFVPGMRAWHHDWRSPAKLRRTWVSYSRGCGIFFAKNLVLGHHRRLMLRLLRDDLRDFAKALVLLARTGRVPWWDPRFGTFPGIPIGLAVGFWRFRRR